MGEQEMKEGLDPNNLHTYRVTIRSELRFLIVGIIVDLKCRVMGANPLERSGSGLEPYPEQNPLLTLLSGPAVLRPATRENYHLAAATLREADAAANAYG
jgi:hypothetical protein